MESLEIIKIKLRGIINCIDRYTSEPSIMNIIHECEKALENDNIDIILFSTQEISKWYDTNIRDINKNEFVYNKEVHNDNVRLIKDIINNIKEYSKEYKKQISNQEQNRVYKNNNDVVINLMNRFHFVARQIRNRYNDRETLDVTDEYDVQDLLHALLYINFDDIRDEEWCPSYAAKCSRQDFLLKNEKIVIETKKTRKGLDAKKLADELIVDIARYKEHPDCKTLICFLYDPEERIKNPRGIESDLTQKIDEMSVIVLIRP